MAATRLRAYDATGTVVQAMDVPADGAIGFATTATISKIVFYKGDLTNEVVCGSIDGPLTGAVSVMAVDTLV